VSWASFRHAPTALTRSVGEEILVALPEGEDIISLAGTSAEVWRALGEDGRTLPDLVDALAQAYRAAPETLGGDVRALLTDLIERGLVEGPKDG